MQEGFDIHNYHRRMELALKKLQESKIENEHYKEKILKFLDYIETQDVSLPRRVHYLQNLTKLARMLDPIDFSETKKENIELVILQNNRLIAGHRWEYWKRTEMIEAKWLLMVTEGHFSFLSGFMN